MTQDLRRENAWFSICYKPHWYKIVKKMRWRVRGGGGVMLSILYMTHKRIQAEGNIFTILYLFKRTIVLKLRLNFIYGIYFGKGG